MLCDLKMNKHGVMIFRQFWVNSKGHNDICMTWKFIKPRKVIARCLYCTAGLEHLVHFPLLIRVLYVERKISSLVWLASLCSTQKFISQWKILIIVFSNGAVRTHNIAREELTFWWVELIRKCIKASVYDSVWCHDDPGHGTRNCKRWRWVFSYCLFFYSSI